jgi:hypothetical protein
MQDYILEYITKLDKTGYNVKVYQDMFESMDDKQFDKWVDLLESNPNCKLTFLVPPLKVAIDIPTAIAVAKELGIELFEQIRIWDEIGQRYCTTPNKYMVVRLPVRRLKQYLMDGLSVPDSDRKLNPLTNQVVGESKGSAISFPQGQMLAEKGLSKVLLELTGVRGGDLEAYASMIAQIEEVGDADTSVMEGTSGVTSVQTLRTFLNAMHLVTNL